MPPTDPNEPLRAASPTHARRASTARSAPELPEVPELPGRPASSRTHLVWLAAIFLVALALRAYYVFEIWPHPAARLPILDAEAYRRIALEIRAGDWLGDAVYDLDPLYPFCLAAIYSIVEPDTRGVLLVQALLDASTVLVVMLVARRVFGVRSAVAAGFLAATYKLFFYFSGLLQKEALMLFLLMSAMLAILRAAERDRPRAWLPAGSLIGLAALTRGNSLLFAPALLAWIAIEGRGSLARRAAAGLCFTLGVAAIILPVTLRNFVVGGDLVLLNSQAGQNFYIGNFRANRTGAYQAPPFLRPNPDVEEQDFAAEAARRTGRSDLLPSEISSFWLREGLAEIQADPVHFLWHTGKKLVVFANAYEIPDNSSFEYFQRNVSPLLNLPLPTWAIVLPLAVAGMAMSYRRREARVLMLFFASYTAGILLFFNLSRMRLPVVPVAIVFAGFAIVEGWDRLRRRELRGLVLPGLLVGAIGVLTQVELPHQPLNIRHFNLGTAFLRRSEASWREGMSLREAGDAEAARVAFAHSLAARDDADAEFARGLEQFPDYERLRTALRNSMLIRVVVWETLEEPASALEAARALTSRFDRFPMGFVALGRAYERVGDREAAAAAFARALRLYPSSLDAAEGLERTRGNASAPEAGSSEPLPSDVGRDADGRRARGERVTQDEAADIDPSWP